MTALAAPATVPTARDRQPDRLRAGAVVLAWPLWSTVSLAQVSTRDGFDLTRHPLSLLATGSLGWLQITNFLVAGTLLLVGGSALRQLVRGRWVSRCVQGSGIGLIAAGLLVMDPMDAFPLGTPAGMSASMSWHSVGHMIAGTVTFALMITACYGLAVVFRRAGRRGLATASALAGTALLLGDGYATTGAPLGSLTLAVGALICGLWTSTATALLVRHPA